MRVRHHKGFGHGLGKHDDRYLATDMDINYPSCQRERAEGVTPNITGSDD